MNVVCATSFFLLFPLIGFSAEVERLPYPRALYHKVEFWKSVYTKYTTRQGVLHDAEDLSIIYEEVTLPKNRNERVVGERRAVIREALFGILRKKGQNLSATERMVLSKFPKYASRSRLLQATENIRFQLGQADRFRQGVINSGRYLKDIEVILKEEGLPDFIKYLPHVESSFNRGAISKFGAAGLWQLMPATGRRYIRVDYVLDERLDPWHATRAAARFLKETHKRLKEWPLALTAYNHGPGGVARAVQEIGSSDIAEIAFQYSSPSFGFASRNFYAQFLAAVQVAQDYQQFFGDLPLEQRPVFESVKLTQDTYFKTLSARYKMTEKEWKDLNPSWRPPVFQNRRPIPRGVSIRVTPRSKADKPLVASLDPKHVKEAVKIQKDDQADSLVKKIESEQAAIKAPSRKSSKKAEKLPEVPSISSGDDESGPPAVALPSIDDLMGEPKYAVKDLVGNKAWIRVEINETISQIAEWLKVPVKDIREWNALGARGQARLGQRLIVKFQNVAPQEFENTRFDHHRKISEDFFENYEVNEFLDYEVKAGENLWSLCFQKFDVPPWLLEQFNPDMVLWDLKPGVKLRIPVVTEANPAISNQVSEVQQAN